MRAEEGGHVHAGDDPALAPALEDVGLHQREAPHLADLPHAAFLDEAVAEGGDFPPALLLVRFAQHAEFDPARPRLVATGRDLDGDVELDPVVELAVPEPGRAHRLEPAADARLAAPHALAADFDDALVCKQIDDVVPHLAVLVEAVGRLEVADAVLVVEAVDPLLERGERRRALGRGADCGRDRNAGRIDGVVTRNHRQVAAAPIGPAGVVGAVELGIVMRLRDLPDAALTDIVILEHAAFDPRLAARAVEDPAPPSAPWRCCRRPRGLPPARRSSSSRGRRP